MDENWNCWTSVHRHGLIGMRCEHVWSATSLPSRHFSLTQLHQPYIVGKFSMSWTIIRNFSWIGRKTEKSWLSKAEILTEIWERKLFFDVVTRAVPFWKALNQPTEPKNRKKTSAEYYWRGLAVVFRSKLQKKRNKSYAANEYFWKDLDQ